MKSQSTDVGATTPREHTKSSGMGIEEDILCWFKLGDERDRRGTAVKAGAATLTEDVLEADAAGTMSDLRRDGGMCG
jgi:hypothetical protein